MPDAGRAKGADYQIEVGTGVTDFPALPWKCEGSAMLNVYFEVRKEALLDFLPREFNRTSPAYCRLFVINHLESPVGPFAEATLALGCRFNMLPGSFAAASITDNAKALAAGMAARGFPSRAGKIQFEASDDRARAMICDQSGGLIAAVELPSLQTIEPSRLAYDHVDAFRTVGKNGASRTELVVTSPDFQIHQAAICKQATIQYGPARDKVWEALRCRNVISAQLVRGVRTFASAHQPGQH